MTSIALLNRCPPHGAGTAQESLDLALAAGSFGQQVSLFFIDDGVWQLRRQQQSNQIEQRNISNTFKALEFYDIDNIFVCEASLHSRGLTPTQLCIDVTLLSPALLRDKMLEADHILSF